MPKLIIIRGNSGSGKTTVSKELQKKFGHNTMVISQDTVRLEILWVKDGAETKALPLLISLLEYGRNNSKITILEGILDAECYSPLFERAVELYGSDIFAYYYDIPFEETLRRHSMKPNRLDFGENEMRRWWNEKDFINFIPEHIITEEDSLSDTVDMIFRQVSGHYIGKEFWKPL